MRHEHTHGKLMGSFATHLALLLQRRLESLLVHPVLLERTLKLALLTTQLALDIRVFGDDEKLLVFLGELENAGVLVG